MSLFGIHGRLLLARCVLLIACTSGAAQKTSTTVINGRIKKVPSLRNAQVKMLGKSELHFKAEENPAENCKFNLASEDAWLFFENIRPSVVAETMLDRIWVDGTPAALDENVRIVQYGEGTVVIPHSPDFKPLKVFSSRNFKGTAQMLEQYTQYDAEKLGSMASTISSFILKRGYMATFAENEDGTGHSKVYIAQDFDLKLSLPSNLDDRVRFVRVFPWRWTSKKGGANLTKGLNLSWWYNWNLNENSTLDMEYVAIKQKRHWPGLDEDWKKRGINHLLGYNEPDKEDQANIDVDTAISGWPELLKTGLRVGSPAVTDSGLEGKGLDWLLEFMEKAEEKNYRVDFVAVHYYRSFWDSGDPDGAADQLYNYLKNIHEETGLPIWITEWNNGANWTDDNHDPSVKEQGKAIEAMVEMLDDADFVERYAIYNWVEDIRRVQQDDGSLTPAGEAYRDEPSPIGYEQTKK